MCAGIGWTKVYRLHDSSGNELDPLPFHICNVFMHAVVTYLVYLLALRLCVARDSLVVPSTAAAGSGLHREGDPAEGFGTGTKQPKKRKGGADTGLRQRRSSANAEQIVFGGGNHKASGGLSRSASYGTSHFSITSSLLHALAKCMSQLLILLYLVQGRFWGAGAAGSKRRRSWRPQYSRCTQSMQRQWRGSWGMQSSSALHFPSWRCCFMLRQQTSGVVLPDSFISKAT